MTDIVERLRKRMTSHELHDLPDEMSQVAADEIERLRSTLKSIADAKPHHAGQTPNEYWFQEAARKALEERSK